MALNLKFNAKNGISVGLSSIPVIDNVGDATFNSISASSNISVSGTSFLNGDVEIINSINGIILKSPDGTRYRITVTNGGALSSTDLTPEVTTTPPPVTTSPPEVTTTPPPVTTSPPGPMTTTPSP